MAGDVEPATARRFDRAIIVVLVLAVALFAVDRFVLDPRRDAELVVESNDKNNETANTRFEGEFRLTMALASGTRIGSYEVAEQIGAGGLGEVYRTTDTNLKRDVAIKVLPESFAKDPDRLASFQREAQVLASLNHANIAQTYGLEKAGDQTMIVMELVEGPTLADRIKDGPIAPDEALGIARQVADALEAAHGLQVAHRNLKPANVKLRPDGTIKVLDFGIAKAVQESVGPSKPHQFR